MKLIKYLVASGLLLSSLSAHAGLCGVGRVAEVFEGRNDTDNLFVKLDFNVPGGQQWPEFAPDGSGSNIVMLPDEYDNNQTFWYKFNSTNVPADRLKAIRTMAYLALANGNTVKLISRWGGASSCQNLHEIIVVSTQIDPNV